MFKVIDKKEVACFVCPPYFCFYSSQQLNVSPTYSVRTRKSFISLLKLLWRKTQSNCYGCDPDILISIVISTSSGD
jgi:hypothetical protein